MRADIYVIHTHSLYVNTYIFYCHLVNSFCQFCHCSHSAQTTQVLIFETVTQSDRSDVVETDAQLRKC